MTKRTPDISATDLKNMLAARSDHARQEFERGLRDKARKSQVLAPFIPQTAAVPVLSSLDDKARQLITSVGQQAPERERRQGGARANGAGAYDGVWTELYPANAAVEWHGPDASSGRVGAKLISHAEGDRTAFSMVLRLFTADRDGIMQAYAQAVLATGYEDTGGIGPSSARSRGALGIWIDQAPAGPYGLAFAESVIWDANQLYPFPGIPYFDAWSAPSNYFAQVDVACQVQAGVTYALWAGAAQQVGTWGPVGAQSNLDMNITYIGASLQS